MRQAEDGAQLEQFIIKVGRSYFSDCVKGARNRVEALAMLGFESTNSTAHAFEKFMGASGLVKDHFSNAWNEKKLVDTFVLHGDGKRHTNGKILKRCLIRLGRIYRCEGLNCTNDGTWLGKPLTLEVDHSNGDRSDDRSENLRFLCPNCHSQTQSYKTPFAKRYNRTGKDRWKTRRENLESKS